MITATEFRKLDKTDQIHMAIFAGEYIAYRHVPNCTVYLHYLDGLFIEIFHVTSKSIDAMVNVFVGPGPLDNYLDNIDLKSLMD